MDPKDTVRRGYDALSYRYRGDTEVPEHYGTWLAQLQERIPAGGDILDLGCGCGVSLARDLAASGYEVIGVDLSAVQVERARVEPRRRGDLPGLDRTGRPVGAHPRGRPRG
jgi:2-polyprenyl-3-methyl-5-hydroxy-6-metoxy-1,4-benzoquinol methylase